MQYLQYCSKCVILYIFFEFCISQHCTLVTSNQLLFSIYWNFDMAIIVYARNYTILFLYVKMILIRDSWKDF